MRGETPDAKADIYSLGLVLYRLLNRNRDPFIDPGKQIVPYGEREEAIRRRLKGDAVPPPLNGSAQLKAAVLKACEPDPAKRYASAAAFQEALVRCMETGVPAATAKRIPWFPVSAGCLVAALGVAVFLRTKEAGLSNTPGPAGVVSSTSMASLAESPAEQTLPDDEGSASHLPSTAETPADAMDLPGQDSACDVPTDDDVGRGFARLAKRLAGVTRPLCPL